MQDQTKQRGGGCDKGENREGIKKPKKKRRKGFGGGNQVPVECFSNGKFSLEPGLKREEGGDDAIIGRKRSVLSKYGKKECLCTGWETGGGGGGGVCYEVGGSKCGGPRNEKFREKIGLKRKKTETKKNCQMQKKL